MEEKPKLGLLIQIEMDYN